MTHEQSLLFPNGPTPTVEMLKAGNEELAKWLGKTPDEINDLIISCVWFVMYRTAERTQSAPFAAANWRPGELPQTLRPDAFLPLAIT